MFNIFIKRPVLSLVISLFITLLGLLAIFTLPISQFPEIVPPSVTVTAKYTGANAEVSTKAVATPLERAINGVPGMTYMTSVSSNNGTTLIQIFFEVGTDPDLAAVNVQNRVQMVIDELPEEVIRAGVVTEKEVNSMLLYLNIMSTDENTGEKFVYNFADINVLQELKRIDGVGFCEIMGSREYSMRVWLKPDRMVAYEVSTDEVIEAIRNQNVEAAPGKAGESSGSEAQMLQYVLRYTGKFFEPGQYENLVIRANEDGSILKLRDIADIEFGSMSYSMSSKTDARPSASIMIKQRPGSNASEVIENVKLRMAELKESSFPPGMTYNIAYDVSRFLDASMHEVLRTLIEAFILVSLVVFIFLQDWRSTLIPALAVPVALIGTFFFMQLLGFSINLLTLFALVLAIGIVVDNAIVVVEAVHAKMAEEHLPPREATFAAMKEISGAIVAITLVMSAVFIPVAFMSGPVGIFYRQFSLTLAIAIVISGINAVTLTPALCALLLKNTHGEERKGVMGWFFGKFNRGYNAVENKYRKTVHYLAGRRLVTVIILLLFFVATWGISTILPTGFIPTEDQGMIYVNVTTPSGATVERTEEVLDKIQQVAERMEAVENVSTLAGYSLLTEAAGASYGMGMINLKAWDERSVSVDEIITLLEEQTRNITDASIEFFPPPTVPGFGNSSGFELRLLDRGRSGQLQATADVANKFITELRKAPEISSAFTSFDASFPQYMIHVDQEMAAKKGVTVSNAMSTLQTLLGSYYASNFIRFGQMYKVMVQAAPDYRAKPEDLLNLFVKNKKGEMVPFSTFIRLERVYGPEQLTRYNMYTSAMINGSPAPGYSSGDAIKAVERVARETLPRGYTFEWSGMTREEILSGNQAIYIFIICLVFVYLLLAAQYESFLLPLPVILSLPTGIFGAFLALQVLGLQNNIYAQVALVMLIGLLGKNAILIVEFAIQRRQEGSSVLEAAVEGAGARLRPILMTSFAFIAGLIPLCIATGAGALGNRSIGTAAAGGMLIGTLFGVILIPGLYVLFASLTDKRKSKKRKEQKLHNKFILSFWKRNLTLTWMKNLKKRLRQGETLNGCWLNLGSSLTAEIVGLAGFDWVLIDLEHGAGEEKDVLFQLQALEHTSTAALVRVESSESQRIGRVLDMGAEGIMCPRINTVAEAIKVVKGLHYPPAGNRGVAKMVRATGFGHNFPEYYKHAGENILGIVQIETAEVLNHLDEIAAIEEIDVLFIGPADLSMELGIFGQFEHPLFKDALKATIDAAQKAGKATGILFFNPDDYVKYHEMGIRFIACGADATFVAEGARSMAGKLNTIRSSRNPETA